MRWLLIVLIVFSCGCSERPEKLENYNTSELNSDVTFNVAGWSVGDNTLVVEKPVRRKNKDEEAKFILVVSDSFTAGAIKWEAAMRKEGAAPIDIFLGFRAEAKIFERNSAGEFLGRKIRFDKINVK